MNAKPTSTQLRCYSYLYLLIAAGGLQAISGVWEMGSIESTAAKSSLCAVAVLCTAFFAVKFWRMHKALSAVEAPQPTEEARAVIEKEFRKA